MPLAGPLLIRYRLVGSDGGAVGLGFLRLLCKDQRTVGGASRVGADNPPIRPHPALIEIRVVHLQHSRPGEFYAPVAADKDRPAEAGVAVEGRSEMGGALEGRLVEPGVALEDRPAEVGVALEDRPSELGGFLEGRPAEPNAAPEIRPFEPGLALEGHPAKAGVVLEDRPAEPGVALEDRPAERGFALEGRLVELGVALEGRPAKPALYDRYPLEVEVDEGGAG
jgi:hypothetical protein